MSYPNEAERKAEWLNQSFEVHVKREDGQYLWRKYKLDDGQVPQSAIDELQELVDTLLDMSEI